MKKKETNVRSIVIKNISLFQHYKKKVLHPREHASVLYS